MCGIGGIISKDVPVAQPLYALSWSMQHRGKESAGAVTYNNGYHVVRGMGTIERVYGEGALDTLDGFVGGVHVRYSTTGESTQENIQPIVGNYQSIPFFLSHNGNLRNTKKLRTMCSRAGYYFRTTTDTELIAGLIHIASVSLNFEEALLNAVNQIKGTYALVVVFKNTLYGLRDPSGIRPLVLGQGKGMTILASESSGCDVLGVDYVRDIEPGEMIKISNGGDSVTSRSITSDTTPRSCTPCVFESVYFSRPDSIVLNRRIQTQREHMGRYLFHEHPVEADIVIPVLDSGYFAAAGYAEESGIPLKLALFRYHYIGRTFIEPIQKFRESGLRLKFNEINELIVGKRIVIVDDSQVRGTVMKRVVAMLRRAEAQEIHVRISSPPYRHPCYDGIDTYRVKDELIAQRHDTVQGVCNEIGADSLEYLSLVGLERAILNTPTVTKNGANGFHGKFCNACFSGNYLIST